MKSNMVNRLPEKVWRLLLSSTCNTRHGCTNKFLASLDDL